MTDKISKLEKKKEASVKLNWNEEKRNLAVEEIEGAGTITRAVGHSKATAALIQQIAVLGSHGQSINEDATNFVLGFIETMKPRDAAEVLLLSQMAVIHQATMMMARRLNHVENLPQQDSAQCAVTKLARTFSTQMDSLKRYRRPGKQVVRVERVNVESGGQAIVGAVNQKGEG